MKHLNKYTEYIKENKIEDFLSEHQIKGGKERVNVKDLIPTQNEIFIDEIVENLLQKKKFVKKALKGKFKDEEIIISSDNHIIDGHHKWASAFILNPNCRIKVTKINLKIKKAIKLFNKLLDEINANNQSKSGLFKYNIFKLIKNDKDELKDVIKKLFSKKSGNEEKLLKRIKILSDVKHPLNYMIENIYKLPTPDHKKYDRDEMPQLSDDEIKEILD